MQRQKWKQDHLSSEGQRTLLKVVGKPVLPDLTELFHSKTHNAKPVSSVVSVNQVSAKQWDMSTDWKNT